MMSASSYWDKAEFILNDGFRYDDTWIATTTDALINIGWVNPSDRQAVVDELGKHDDVYYRDDFDADCKCGKWLEDDYYEWPDHMSSVLTELNLLNDPDYVPPPPRQPRKPSGPVPAAFQFPRKMLGPSDWLDRVEAGMDPVEAWRDDDVSLWEYRVLQVKQ